MATLRDSILIDPQVVKERRRPSFFGFDIFITPLLIKLAFIVGIIGCLVQGCLVVRESWSIAVAAGEDPWIRLWSETLFWTGIGTIFLGPIILRIWCESMIVIFKIFEELRRR